MGVQRANTEARRIKRSAFVEGLLNTLPILEFDLETARVHAKMRAAVPKSITIGAHDIIIAATAVRHGFPVLTGNVTEFSYLPEVTVIPFG